MAERYVQALRQDIVFITKIFESMGHLALVTTLDRQKGLLRIRYSSDFEEVVMTVLETLPCQLWVMESLDS